MEIKFDNIQTENSRLRSELHDVERKLDIQGKEVVSKEEQLRQRNWQLEDERQSRQADEDTLQRLLQQTKLEVSNIREIMNKEKLDMEEKLKRVIKPIYTYLFFINVFICW